VPVALRGFAIVVLVGVVLVPTERGRSQPAQPYLRVDEEVFEAVEIPSPVKGSDDDKELKPPDWCDLDGPLPSPSRGYPALGEDPEESGEAPLDLATTTTSGGAVPGREGIGDTGFCPPDPTIAAGPDHLLTAVNSSIASYAKSTLSHQWTVPLKRWLSPLRPRLVELGIEQDLDVFFFHPSLVYDQEARRFLLVVAAVDSTPQLEPDQKTLQVGISSVLMIGASGGPNPNSAWCFSAIPATGFSHYPRIGYNDGRIYVTNNEYLPSTPEDSGRTYTSSPRRICSGVAIRASSPPSLG
jgi:hypothetical protein